jgi:hypothetical protein
MSASQGETLRSRFPPAGDADRAAVLRYVAEAPLRYGEWKHLKALYKQAEQTGEAEILGTLIGRLDAEPLSRYAAAQQFRLEFPAFTGTCAVAASGPTLYLASGPNRYTDHLPAGHPAADRARGDLSLIDLTRPVQPRSLGSVRVPGIRALATQGELVYAAGRGLQVVDVSDPRRPRVIGSLEAGRFQRLVAAGRYLYCLGEDNQSRSGLLVVDVADPTRPREAAFLEIPGARDLCVAGRYAYIVGESGRQGWFGLRRTGGLHVLDLADPARPRVAGHATVAGARAIAVSGSYAYICAWDERRQTTSFHVFHLFTPATPRPAGSVILAQFRSAAVARWNLAVHGTSVFVANDYTGVRVVNAANPTRPAAAATYPTYGTPGLALLDSVVCIAGTFGELLLFDIGDPARPVLLGAPPSADTFRYMKRRARRLLRHLARQDPDSFVKVAYHALAAAGRPRPELDPACQWVSIDLLFGGSGRYAQASHGEGACYPRWQCRFVRRREERGPEAWDRRPDLAQRLLTATDLPWQTREAALKMLRGRGVALPALPPVALAAMLRSPAPLLVIAAAREAARQVLGGTRLEPEIAAAAFFAANGRARRRLTEHWSHRAESAEWDTRFAAQLGRIAGERSEGVPNRRVIAAAALLAGQFAASLSGDALLPTAVALLASEREPVQALAVPLVATASPSAAPEWLAALGRLPEDRRDHAVEVLIAALRGRTIDLPAARRLAFAETTWAREAGWRLLAALPAPATVLAALWTEILAAEGLPPALRTALHSAAALETLRTARMVNPDLDARLSERALRAELLTLEWVGDVTPVAPPGLLVRMVTEAGAADWERLRDALLDALEESGRLTAFWQAAWPALEADATGLLNRRLLEDARMADSFLEVDGAEFLESRYPAVARLLLRWVEWRREQFPRDSLELLAAATAPLPEVREWGLRQVAALGMELPFALRLLESGLPAAAEAGRTFFEALPPGDSDEREYALALCDSPEPAVRAYGREYVRQRWDTLPREDLLRHLSEHADPLVQEFVARILLDDRELAAAAGGFDRTVLRTPDRSRRAKELVKRRLAKLTPEEIPLLLEMARSRTGHDAEWAWSRLAQLALDGHEIDGFTLDGTAGV